MSEDELDNLYSVKPNGFTAMRGKLAAAAKRRGDAAAAERISAARKPTTAAWVVNRLVLQQNNTKQRLKDLGEKLRAAHADMDAESIRGLSTEQRRLLDELTQSAFDTAEIDGPSAALREDVANTLQAAIADADVNAKLGRLDKAERWSGFGTFGAVGPTATSKGKKPPPEDQDKLRNNLAAAEHAKAAADKALSERRKELTTARKQHDEARRSLHAAERALDEAGKAYDSAQQASRDAAASVKDAKAQLRRQR